MLFWYYVSTAHKQSILNEIRTLHQKMSSHYYPSTYTRGDTKFRTQESAGQTNSWHKIFLEKADFYSPGQSLSGNQIFLNVWWKIRLSPWIVSIWNGKCQYWSHLKGSDEAHNSLLFLGILLYMWTNIPNRTQYFDNRSTFQNIVFCSRY
jgi:hypothetical protein